MFQARYRFITCLERWLFEDGRGIILLTESGDGVMLGVCCEGYLGLVSAGLSSTLPGGWEFGGSTGFVFAFSSAPNQGEGVLIKIHQGQGYVLVHRTWLWRDLV